MMKNNSPVGHYVVGYVDSHRPLRSTEISRYRSIVYKVYAFICVGLSYVKKNGKDGFGRGRHSHPGGTYRNPGSTGFVHSMDRYVHAICSCFSIAVAETSVNKQSGLWIRRDHTLHIQCGNVTHYADGCVNRGLIITH
jgi:hypothetical protein